MNKAILIAGLGFGDEGKGTVTQFLAHDLAASLVVRYNGGAQAAHNVYSRDGKHHTFSQFGSGTLEGARTFLSRFMLVEPHSLLNEGRHLISIGVPDPYSLLTIDRDALLITPFHWATNRFKEMRRGTSRHGSCGMGIGEAMSDFLAYGSEVCPTMGDLESPVRLYDKFCKLQDLKLDELRELTREVPPQFDEQRVLKPLLENVEHTVERYRGLTDVLHLVDGNKYLKHAMQNEIVIFEGAQGVLLDQDYGFHPQTTWTDITFKNAQVLLDEAHFSGDRERIGVVRSYATRHGAGPFPTEDTEVNEILDKHNSRSLWQGHFRVGYFDTVLARYALDVLGGVDQIALTHADQHEMFGQLCTHYRIHHEDRGLFTGDSKKEGDGSEYDVIKSIDVKRPADYQRQLSTSTALARVTPIYTAASRTLYGFIEDLQFDLRAHIKLLSSGPLITDKAYY